MADPQTSIDSWFELAIDNSIADAGQRRLRYHLLRLTVAGLRREELDDLGELGRLAFQSSSSEQVVEQADKVKARPELSRLAAAITDLVATATRSPASTRDVFLGAVLGAYAGLHSDGDAHDAAVIGAIGGAIAVSANTFITERIGAGPLDEYLATGE